jgi:hypothetical protein
VDDVPGGTPPEPPSEPLPPPGAIDVTVPVTLSVAVSDPDGDALEVTFYDAVHGAILGVQSGVPSGTRAGIVWTEPVYGAAYDWYAVVSDGSSVVVSPVWSFLTKPDSDVDGVPDDADNCIADFNPDQANSDGNVSDGGDACDLCPASYDNDCDAWESGSGVMGPAGGTVTNASGMASLSVPPGALPGDVTLSITNDPDVTSGLVMADDTRALRCSYTFTPEGMIFEPVLTLTMHWSEEDAVGVAEEAIDIYWYNPAGSTWESQSATCDMVNNYCQIVIRHFSDYVLGYEQDLSGVGNQGPTPTVLRLWQNEPNPFNPRTTIRFDLPAAGPIRLVVYDLAGRLVRVLVEGEMPAGNHEAVWDGRDASGRSAPSGSYLARLIAGGKVEVVRMGLVR